MLVVRQLTNKDIPAYRKARVHCLEVYPNSFTTSPAEEAQKKHLLFEPFLQDNHPNNFLYGAMQAEACVGLCGFIRSQRLRVRHTGSLVHMYVHPDYTRQGLGQRLVQAVCQHAFEHLRLEVITLDVLANNTSAIDLYKRLGFQTYGHLPGGIKFGDHYVDIISMMIQRASADH